MTLKTTDVNMHTYCKTRFCGVDIVGIAGWALVVLLICPIASCDPVDAINFLSDIHPVANKNFTDSSHLSQETLVTRTSNSRSLSATISVPTISIPKSGMGVATSSYNSSSGRDASN